MRHHILIVAVALLSVLPGSMAETPMAVADDPQAGPTEAEVEEAEAEARELEKALSDIRSENRVLEERRKALSVTADLMRGLRDVPPEDKVAEKTVLVLCEQPVALDNRETGEATVFKKWLNLPSGRNYRVRARLEIREISGTDNFKFGMMVPRPGGRTDWPAARIGGQPFAEREVQFDFHLPEDGTALFLMGFEKGKGVASFRDVRVSELMKVPE